MWTGLEGRIRTQLKKKGEQVRNIPDAAEIGPRYLSAVLDTDLPRPLAVLFRCQLKSNVWLIFRRFYSN